MWNINKLFSTLTIVVALGMLFSCGKKGNDDFLADLNPPTSLYASISDSLNVTLNWYDNSSNETGFVIQRATEGVPWYELAKTGEGVAAYSDFDLDPGTTYYYRVQAYIQDKGVSDYSNQASATTASFEKDGVLIAKVEIEWNVAGRDRITVDEGAMQVEHLEEGRPNDPRVKIARWVDGDWEEMFDPHKSWNLNFDENAPSTMSEPFDMELTELIENEFSRIVNLKIEDKPDDGTVSMNSDNGTITFNDTAIDDPHHYLISFEYWYTALTYVDIEPVEYELALAEIELKPKICGGDYIVIENNGMQVLHMADEYPEDDRIWVDINGSDDWWDLTYNASGESNIYDLDLTDYIDGGFNRLANLRFLNPGGLYGDTSKYPELIGGNTLKFNYIYAGYNCYEFHVTVEYWYEKEPF